MKSLSFKLIAFLIIITTTVSCLDDGVEGEQTCVFSVVTPVATVTGPETTTVNQPITLSVKFNTLSICNVTHSFTETTGFPKQVNVVLNYNGCNCSNTPISVTKPYVFTSATTGEYILKFLTGNNTFITKTITVTQ